MSKKTYEEAQKTKQSILAAAKQVFTEKGYAKTSLSDIARVAQVTRGAIYWHFENKGELLAALVEEQFEQLNLLPTLRAAAAENQRDPLGLIYKWAMLHFQADTEDFIVSPLADIFQQVMATEATHDAQERLIELIESERQMIKDAFKRAVALGQLSSKVDPELVASYVHGTIVGLIVSLRDGLHIVPYQSSKLIVETMFRHLNDLQLSA